MKPILLVPCGATGAQPADFLFAAVTDALAHQFQTTVSLASQFDTSFAHHPERNQYNSTSILEHLTRLYGQERVLVGVTGLDLFIPILTFVFGEAHLDGTCAVVSWHRLTQEFYGLPADDGLTTERLVKEAIHEVGHTVGLTHCDDYACVMAASHAVEWLDLKGSTLCKACRRNAGL